MKQIIEIEVPDGMKAIWENGTIKYVPNEPHWKKITTFKDALQYVQEHLSSSCKNLLKSYRSTLLDSFENNIACYRIIVTALTNNEERHLVTGDKWYPIVQFCRPKDKDNCWGNVLIGTIESEGARYSVIGGRAGTGGVGLGSFFSGDGVSDSIAAIGFRSVSSKEIAEHISTYFGKLLFEIHYGGTNCDWKWID